MGQKVNPNGFRYGVTKQYNSIWFANKDLFPKYLIEDQKIRKFFDPLTREMQIGNIEITRNQNNRVVLSIFTAKPGVVLGKEGANIKKMAKDIQIFVRNRKLDLRIEVVPILNPELNAKLVAEEIAIKLENRAPFRIAQKFAIKEALKSGAIGIKTKVSGRLNGVDMARSEGYQFGEMKLHTLKQNVDYATATARTTYGAIGIKVWISLGEYGKEKTKDYNNFNKGGE